MAASSNVKGKFCSRCGRRVSTKRRKRRYGCPKCRRIKDKVSHRPSKIG